MSYGTPALYQDKTAGANQVRLAASFVTNGTGAIDPTTIKGKGVASVTRVAAGQYQVTLSGSFLSLIAASGAAIENPGSYVSFSNAAHVSDATSPYIFVNVVFNAALTDTSGARIAFDLVLSTDTLNK